MLTPRRSALLVAASLGLGFACLGGQTPAEAQNPLGSEFQVNSYTTGAQESPEVARNADGEFLVVWESDQLGRTDVFGQAYDGVGVPLGGEFHVPIGSFQHSPAVAADPDGNFIVVVTSTTGNAGQKYDASGTPLGASFFVGGVPNGSGGPDVASAADGSFVVVWEAPDGPYGAYGIWGRRFDSSGNPLTGAFGVNDFTMGWQLVPAVASAPNGDFVVVWTDYGTSAAVRARRFDSAGNPLSGELQVARGLSPDIAMAENGDFVVVWDSLPILGRRFDASGNPLGGELTISTTGSQPAITADVHGDFVVTWSSQSDTFAREFAADGTPRTAGFLVNTYTTDFQHHPAIASDEAGNFVVAWESQGQDGSGDGIFGQRFEPGLYLSVDGSCPGPVSVSIVNAPASTEVAFVAAANTNGFVKGGQLCPGVQFDIGEPFQLPPTFVIVDGEGNGEAMLDLGANRCFVQALALADCSTSNTVEVP